jgi:hypothetical protein
MSLITAARVLVHPSFEEPEILLQYNQASQFVDALAGGEVRARIGEDDLFVYMKYVNLRTQQAAGQAGMNELPGVQIFAGMLQVPTYLAQVRANYNHHDVRAAGNYGFSAVEAYRLGMRQANYQFARDGALHGFNPQNGEGLLNAVGATTTNLPPDTFGHTTVLTYDNGEMAFQLSQYVLAIKTRTNQLGMGRDFAFLGPQRTMGQFEYNVVQLTQFQRPGAGTASTVELLENILGSGTNKDRMTWGYDDTLQGAGGTADTDVVLIVMTEIEKPRTTGISTNAFAALNPGNKACTTQYCDKVAPTEIMSPMAGGATDFLMEWRLSPGWGVRPTCITIVNMLYS